MKQNNRVAVFIDAENISSKYAERVFNDAAGYGDVIVKRIYSDWSLGNAAGAWKDSISRFSLIAEQNFCPVKGKSSSDIALIIDAMLVFFEKEIDVFCLVSSDSDFTRLVQEFRERGKLVVGFGERKTNQSFVNAFSEFIYLDESVAEKVEEVPEKKEETPKAKKPAEPQPNIPKEQFKTLQEIINEHIEDSGKALFSQIANEMKNKHSDFLPKNYGCKSMKQLLERLVKRLGHVEINTEADGTTLYFAKKIRTQK